MVAGQHPANVQAADFLHRFKELPGVGGGVKRVQTAQVGQVAGVQVFPLGLIKAAVARRVAGGVDGFHHPAAQVELETIVKDQLGRALKDLIAFRVETLWESAGLGRQIALDHSRRKGELPVQPVPLQCVDGDGIEMPVAANVVPVDVGGGHRDGKLGQPPDHGSDVRHPQARVDEQGPLQPQQQVAVSLLPVPVFADGEGVPVDFLYGKPAGHVTAPGPSRRPPPGACPSCR